MKKAILIVATVAVIVVAGMVTGCGGPADQVSVQLKWIHQNQFAGMYVADQNGLYAGENIDINLIPFAPGAPPEKLVDSVASGEASFAIVSGYELVSARFQGRPVIAIAVVFQKNPRAYMSLVDSEIWHPRDFAGKKLMVSPQAIPQHERLLQRWGIDPDSIELIPFEFDITPITTGQVDVHQSYCTSLGIQFQQAGYEVNFMYVDDYSVPFYGDTIIASETLASQNPELVERFLRATLEGWRYATAKPDEASDMVLKYDAASDLAYQNKMMHAQRSLILTGKTPVGWMDGSHWEEMRDVVSSEFPGIKIRSEDMFTMRFLNKIYPEAK